MSYIPLLITIGGSKRTFDVTNAHILEASKELQNSFLQFFDVGKMRNES